MTQRREALAARSQDPTHGGKRKAAPTISSNHRKKAAPHADPLCASTHPTLNTQRKYNFKKSEEFTIYF